MKLDHWWEKSKDDCHTSVFSTVKYLDDTQVVQREAMLHHLRLYSNRQALGFRGANYAAAVDGGNKIRLNVVKSCIDTAVAHIATSRPRPLYQTKGGNYDQRLKAEALGKFMLGQFMTLKRYPKGLSIFRDAAIFGPGVEKFYGLNGRVCSERVFPDELVHDQEEASSGEIRQLFQVKDVDKGVLDAEFPGHWAAIEASKRVRDPGETNRSITEPTTLVEAWHLPSSQDADDGRHTICIQGATLVDEPWERERFPFAFFNWSDPVRGIFGIGAAEELAPIQIEINYIAQKIQRLMTLATSFVWKEKGSGVGRLTNKDFAQYEYTGKPPVFQTVASVSAEYFNHLDRLYQRAFEIMGISQLSATSQKPAGLDSGEALRVYNDIGTKRFQHVGQRWEQFHLDAAECIYDVAQDIVNSGDAADVKVLTASDHDIEEINFKDCYLERDQYVMQPFPVSLLPDTPAGKIETIARLAQAVPTMAQHLPLLLTGIPDVEAVVDRMYAPTRIVEKQVCAILQRGESQLPYDQGDLMETRRIATEELLNAHVDGVPEERLDKLRRYISAADALIDKAKSAMMPTVTPGAPGMPQTMVAQPTQPTAQPMPMAS